jgi:hypothetical protein
MTIGSLSAVAITVLRLFGPTRAYDLPEKQAKSALRVKRAFAVATGEGPVGQACDSLIESPTDSWQGAEEGSIE